MVPTHVLLADLGIMWNDLLPDIHSQEMRRPHHDAQNKSVRKAKAVSHVTSLCWKALCLSSSLTPESAAAVLVQGVEASSLNRWGHTSTLYDGKLVVFGG